MPIRTSKSLFLSVAGALTLTTAAHATFVETFTGGTNTAGWGWGYGETYPTTGGNPGDYFRAEGLDTYGPLLSTSIGTPSPFVGDLRAAGVTGMSFDLNVEHTDFPSGGDGFGVTLILTDTHGTDDISDDDYAWFAGPSIPDAGTGWTTYTYSLDAASATLPSGWSGGSYADYTNFNAGYTWNDLVQHVDQVQFSLLTPGWFAIFQQWTVGADNVTVTTAPVPEPATLTALGLGAILAFRRRKRSA